MDNKAVYAMVVAPHPHDPEWGIAGTVARWTREGKPVVFVVCTSGESGTSDASKMPEELAKIREQEQLTSARLLGVNDVIFLRYPDLGLEDTPEFRRDILRLIMTYRPEVVATCDPYYRVRMSNRDHRVTGRVVLDAVWPYALAPNTYRDLLAQGLELHHVREVLLFQTEEPNYRVDITGTFDIKMAAFRCHKSTVGDPLTPEFAARIKERATTAAQGQSYELGEAFHRLEILQRL